MPVYPGAQARSCLPHHQYDGGNFPGQGQASHLRPDALGQQSCVELLKRTGLLEATTALPDPAAMIGPIVVTKPWSRLGGVISPCAAAKPQGFRLSASSESAGSRECIHRQYDSVDSANDCVASRENSAAASHAPTATTNFGAGTTSYVALTASAILRVTGPVTRSMSACFGDATK